MSEKNYKVHPNSKLTIEDRRQIRKLYLEKRHSLKAIAEQFKISLPTAGKWAKGISPFDRKTSQRKKRVVSNEYEQAVIECKATNPKYGAVRIAKALKARFKFANRGTVALILKAQKSAIHQDS